MVEELDEMMFILNDQLVKGKANGWIKVMRRGHIMSGKIMWIVLN